MSPIDSPAPSGANTPQNGQQSEGVGKAQVVKFTFSGLKASPTEQAPAARLTPNTNYGNVSYSSGLSGGGLAREGAKARPGIQLTKSVDYIPTTLSASFNTNPNSADAFPSQSKPSKYSSVADLVPFVDGRPVAVDASLAQASYGQSEARPIQLDSVGSTEGCSDDELVVRPSSIRGLALGSSSDLRGCVSGYSAGSWAPNQHSAKFKFVTFPCDPLPPSFIRSRIFGDAEAPVEFDATVWYQASADEVARDKERALERERVRIEREEKELRRRLEKGKNKAIIKGGAKKTAPRRKKVQREKRTRQIRPAVQATTTTRFAKVAGTGLFPQSEPFLQPIEFDSAFLDLDALPTVYRIDPREAAYVGSYQHPVNPPPPPADVFATTAPAEGSLPPVGQAPWDAAPKSVAMQEAASYASTGSVALGPKRGRELEEGTPKAGAKRKKVAGLGTPGSVGKGASPAPVRDDFSPPTMAGPYDPSAEVFDYAQQTMSCLSKQTLGCIQCYSCVARAVGHHCCFQGMRYFPVTKEGLLAGPPEFRTPAEPDDEPDWNAKRLTAALTPQIADEIKVSMAKQVLPMVQAEHDHATPKVGHSPVKTRLDLTGSLTCDTCLVNMPSASWMCTSCGRESCPACREALIAIEELEARDPGVTLTYEQQRRKKCIAKKRGSIGPAGWSHNSSQFAPLTKYSEAQLGEIHRDVEAHAASQPAGAGGGLTDDQVAGLYHMFETRKRPHDALEDHRPVIRIDASQVADPVAGLKYFESVWARGEPVCITGCLSECPAEWTPEQIVARLGKTECHLVQLATQALTPSTFADFFGAFSRPKLDPVHNYKLLEFSAADLDQLLPGLAGAYQDRLPLGDLLRTNGVRNLGAHTPPNAVLPDFGPRLHAAFGGGESALYDVVASTLLKREVADVANLMLYGGENPTKPLAGKPGFARWDIFRHEDVPAVLGFLHEMLSKKTKQTAERYAETHDDPLLCQQHCFPPVKLLELRERGIRPFTIWQKPGDVVLVPSGCPFQVSTFADCISVGSEFISPQSLQRALPVHELCHQQTKERTIWKTDPLQFKTQLFWTWQSCQQALGPGH